MKQSAEDDDNSCLYHILAQTTLVLGQLAENSGIYSIWYRRSTVAESGSDNSHAVRRFRAAACRVVTLSWKARSSPID